METCENCGKELDPKRNTKRYCGSTCRYKHWKKINVSGKKINVIEPREVIDCLTAKDMLEVLNFCWENDRDFLISAPKQECLNLFVLKLNKEFLFSESLGRYELIDAIEENK